MLRSILIVLLSFISLLSIFPAPTYHLWLLAIAVTEYPGVLIMLTLIVLLSGFWLSNQSLWANILGIIALLLFSSPIVRAYIIADKLQTSLQSSFGKYDPGNNEPFSGTSLFRSSRSHPYQSIPYKETGGKSFSVDFYRSQVNGKKPCIIVIHGGSWSSGDSKQLPELNSYISGEGYNVAAINYRLAPLFQNPAPVEDIKDAIAALRKRADELQIDTNNFVLLGRSAGGQIALLAAYTLRDEHIKGVIDFYGPADMVWGYSVPSNPLVMNSRRVMENYLGGPYSKYPENYEASSPILFVNRQSPPTLIIHGANDVLVSPEHSRRLNEKLQQNGVKHYLLRLPWGQHGFDFNLNGPGGQLSTYAVMYFLKAVTS